MAFGRTHREVHFSQTTRNPLPPLAMIKLQRKKKNETLVAIPARERGERGTQNPAGAGKSAHPCPTIKQKPGRLTAPLALVI